MLISSSKDEVKKIALVVQKNIEFLDWKTEKTVNLYAISIKKGTQIIIDNNFVSFKDSIFIQEIFKRKLVTFKIIPKDSNFMLGSDSSTEGGEVVIIK